MDSEELQRIVTGIREQRHLNPEKEEAYTSVKCGSTEKSKAEARKKIEEIELQKHIDNMDDIGYLMTEPTYSTEELRANSRKGKMRFLKSQSRLLA